MKTFWFLFLLLTLSCVLSPKKACTASSLYIQTHKQTSSINETVMVSRNPTKEDSHSITCIFNLKFDTTEPYIVINVSDYSGATDGERIQKALDDVPEEGAIVFLPAGIWEASNLTAKSKTILTGTDRTIMKRPANTTHPFITFRNQSNFVVIGMIFDGRNTSQATGILIADCTRFQIFNNTFINISKNAVRVCGVCEDFEIENNIFLKCDSASIILFGSPGARYIRNFIVANNHLTNGTSNGKIGVAFAANGTIAYNTLVNCEYGIATRCVSHIAITSNHIENCLSYAIYLGTQPGDPGSDNVEIAYNYASNCRIGISRYYGSQPIDNVTLKGNSIVYSEQWDICADFSATFINNTITTVEKLRILNTDAEFIGNKDLDDQPILPADLNNDLKIDMRDIGVIARLFGSSSSSDNWNPSADIIGDGFIDMKDIAFVARDFGFRHT